MGSYNAMLNTNHATKPMISPTSRARWPSRESPEALAALADATEAKTDDTANSGTSTATGGMGLGCRNSDIRW